MKARLRLIVKRLKTSSIFFVLVGLFVLVVCWERIVIIIPPGHGGVLWHALSGGTRTTEEPMHDGVHVIFPWNRIFHYNLRLESYRGTYNVVTNDGLQVKIGVTYRWRINPVRLGTLSQAFGPQYRDTLISPAISSAARHVISHYTLDDLVSARLNDIQKGIYVDVVSPAIENGIGASSSDRSNVVLLTDILITGVDLPKNVQTAIEDKLRQAQIAQEYGYRVQREELESQRKGVEAEGIRKFQEIVMPGMTNSYLRWRGIEATLELARSPNSKIVVIGNQQSGGLPLIFDGVDRPAASSPPASRSPSAKPASAKPAPAPRP